MSAYKLRVKMSAHWCTVRLHSTYCADRIFYKQMTLFKNNRFFQDIEFRELSLSGVRDAAEPNISHTKFILLRIAIIAVQ